MQLTAILLIPAIASALSLSRPGRRFAAPITLIASAIVLALSASVAEDVAHGGHPDATGGWLTCDGLGGLVLLLVALVSFTAALFSWGYLERGPRYSRRRLQRYYGLYNLFVLSMLAIPLLANVALMWIAVELTTLLSAFLVGFHDTPEALEAAWKYVILTTLGAVIALLGFLILYWGSQVAGFEPFTWVGLVDASPRMPPALLWPAFLLILVGFGTKAGLVPMHTWLPDAHSQAPASICALLSGVETTTALYVILRLFPVIGFAPGLDAKPWFIGFGLLSAGVAALLLIRVRDFKRMFAFSTVEHMGIILVAAGLGGAEAHLGAAYQITGHAVAKSFCFFRRRHGRFGSRRPGYLKRAGPYPLLADRRSCLARGRVRDRGPLKSALIGFVQSTTIFPASGPQSLMTCSVTRQGVVSITTSVLCAASPGFRKVVPSIFLRGLYFGSAASGTPKTILCPLAASLAPSAPPTLPAPIIPTFIEDSLYSLAGFAAGLALIAMI